MVQVNSPPSRVQPLSAPSPLITTNSASQRPEPAAAKRSISRANGALASASSVWWISNSGTVETMM